MMKKIELFSIVLLMIVSSNLWAQKGTVIAHVTRILIADNGKWGGCMALLDRKIRTQAYAKLEDGTRVDLQCPDSGWVTFSCDGTYNSKDIAYRKLDIAQESQISGQLVKAFIDDAKKHNGYCYVWRFDALKN